MGTDNHVLARLLQLELQVRLAQIQLDEQLFSSLKSGEDILSYVYGNGSAWTD